MSTWQATELEKAQANVKAARQVLKRATPQKRPAAKEALRDAKMALHKAEDRANRSLTPQERAANRALNELKKTKAAALHRKEREKQKGREQINSLPQIYTSQAHFTQACTAPTLHAVELCQCGKSDLPSAKFAEIREIAQNILAKRHLHHFVRQAWPLIYPTTPLEWGKHVDAICFHIQTQLQDRWKQDGPLRAQNVLINVPPRSLKTTILSLATVWAWLHEPSMKIMYLSSNPRVSVMSARWAQTIVRSQWFINLVDGQWSLKTDHDALTSYGNTQGGTRTARSLDGAITGEGADWIIVDDPSDVRDSESEIQNMVDGYDAAVHNRITNPKWSIRTGIMQRFRENDFSGHVLEIHSGNPSKGGWLHVRIPTEYVEKPTCACGSCTGINVYGWEDWRTTDGEVIHERFSPEFLAEEKRTKGPYGYAGQHQQEPAPPTGGMLKNVWYQWFRLPEDIPSSVWKRPLGSTENPTEILQRKQNGKLDLDFICISVDGTFGNTSDTKGSAVGLQVYGIQRMRKYLLDDQTEAIPYLDALERIRQLVKDWAHEAPIRVLVEPKAFGPMAVEELRNDLRNGKLVNKFGKSVVVVVEVLKGPDGKGIAGDKITRAHAATPALAAGLIFIREGTHWAHAHINETGIFPNGKRDDRVDTMTQIINFYSETNDIAKARALLRR